MPLFPHVASSVCHNKENESIENSALALECFHPGVTHMTSHMLFIKANYMSITSKSGKVQSSQVSGGGRRTSHTSRQH